MSMYVCGSGQAAIKQSDAWCVGHADTFSVQTWPHAIYAALRIRWAIYNQRVSFVYSVHGPHELTTSYWRYGGVNLNHGLSQIWSIPRRK